MGWVWIAGTSLYALTLLLTLSRRTMEWVRLSSEYQASNLVVLCNSLSTRYTTTCNMSSSIAQPWCRRVASFVILLLHGIFVAIAWLLVQFIAIWSYGCGSHVLEVAVYASFAAWDTWNLVDWKQSNRILIVPRGLSDNVEGSWGFGQVLPLATMVSILFQTVDIVREFSVSGGL